MLCDGTVQRRVRGKRGDEVRDVIDTSGEVREEIKLVEIVQDTLCMERGGGVRRHSGNRDKVINK